ISVKIRAVVQVVIAVVMMVIAKLHLGSLGYIFGPWELVLGPFATPQGRQSLQEARLLATTGHTEQAIASYDKLFKGYPPEGELAV
ncbi:hypothetical protein MJL81_31675, partial [Salmonella enterica subsp. enterica serovar Anatum]|nr:hypothetical protein [Salmonella enterica subsp. enterica serovar Anatum]